MEMDIQLLKCFISHSLIHSKIFIDHLLCSLCAAGMGTELSIAQAQPLPSMSLQPRWGGKVKNT